MIGLKWIMGAVASVSLVLATGLAVAADAPVRGDGMQAGLAVDYYYGDFSAVPASHFAH